MRVIGTAGHVDHGKSSLVQALTGTNPDRLKEEQERQMTIELGFAWFTLPEGEEVGVVDVPGHRDFIENMLAGVGGIDAVLFVVAADEGVMPQTREHLAILDILQIPAGVIVLTKIDLAEDDDWLELVASDVRQVAAGTVLANAPLVRVSARSGAGLDNLRKVLSEILSRQPERPNLGRPRLPVDRVFTIAGFGTVVTGTLLDGELRLGDDVEFSPGGLRGRVRGLQSHKHKVEVASPGSRTAVNVSGVNVEQVARGEVLTRPGLYRPSRLVDVHFRLLPDASAPLRHNTGVKFFLGAAEVTARARLLGVEELQPGKEGWLQIELQEPVVAVRGDHYVLRRPSPGETLGGGIVVDAQPARRHKRFSAETLARLESLRQGTPGDLLLQASLAGGAMSLRELVERAHLSEEQARAGLLELRESGALAQLESGELEPRSSGMVMARNQWEAITDRALHVVEQYHHAYPLRRGMQREELKSRLKLTPRLFNLALQHWLEKGLLVEQGALRLPAFALRLTPRQQAQVNGLLTRFAAAPYAPPSVKECQAEVGDELFNSMIELEMLVRVSAEVVFRAEDYQALREGVLQHFEREPSLTVAQFRDRFTTSRRYVLAFLEHLDAIGVTQRSGDERTLRKTKI